MNPYMMIIYCLCAAIAGLIITINFYPNWEIKKVLKYLRKEGYQFGEWYHEKKLVDHHTKVVVKPNCETLYSLAFIRRKDGSYLLKMPYFDSYFSFAFLSDNSDVQGYYTNRDISYNSENSFLITYDDEEIIDSAIPHIRLQSKLCWIIGRFGVNSSDQIPAVNKLQDSIQLIKLDN